MASDNNEFMVRRRRQLEQERKQKEDRRDDDLVKGLRDLFASARREERFPTAEELRDLFKNFNLNEQYILYRELLRLAAEVAGGHEELRRSNLLNIVEKLRAKKLPDRLGEDDEGE